MNLDLHPLHSVFAAEALGVDLRNPPTRDLCAAIDAAMDRYTVVVLRDQHIDDEQEMAFHAGSGRRSLFLASHIGAIHGMPRPEALMLIRDLTGHATRREFVYSHTWRVHDLVIRDNRCTMHRGRAYDDQRSKRDMRRMTLEDVAPTLAQPA